LPTNKLSLYTLSSFFIAVIIIESGVMAGFSFFAATGLLSIIIVPEKTAVIPYLIFFGLYGIVKFYIEKLKKVVFEYILKFLYFNISIAVVWFTVSSLFELVLPEGMPWWILVVAAEIVFFIYDIVYTLFIKYYREKLRPRLKL